MNIKEKVKFISETYGYEAQSRQCMEECAELIQAINKFWRKCQGCGFVTLDEIKAEETEHSKLADEKEYQNLIEELADVQVMIWQMAYLLNVDKAIIEDCCNKKLDRQLERIRNNEN